MLMTLREDRQAQLTNGAAIKGLIPSEPLALKSPVPTYGDLLNINKNCILTTVYLWISYNFDNKEIIFLSIIIFNQ
jgi:hypothetical protein